jgi:hypothetical protein
MFNSYVSKHGITVIGRKPMFEDVEENLGLAIKEKILEVFGYFPVLDISEKWVLEGEDDYEEDTVLRDYHALLDLEKLDLIPDGELNYVDGLLEKIITHKLEKPDAVDMNAYASKKYCFSDTEDWWTAMVVPEIPEGRKVFGMIVVLG